MSNLEKATLYIHGISLNHYLFRNKDLTTHPSVPAIKRSCNQAKTVFHFLLYWVLSSLYSSNTTFLKYLPCAQTVNNFLNGNEKINITWSYGFPCHVIILLFSIETSSTDFGASFGQEKKHVFGVPSDHKLLLSTLVSKLAHLVHFLCKNLIFMLSM